MRAMADRFVYEVPKRPEPVRVVVEEAIDPFTLRQLWNRPGEAEMLAKHVKRSMTNKLARYLMDECQVFEMPDLSRIRGDTVVRMEFTLHDAGAYQNWLPNERSAGRSEGRKQAVEAMPYGFEPEQYYE